jgi:hypothetical protein
MQFLITYSAWKALFQDKEKRRGCKSGKKEDWRKRNERTTRQVNLVLKEEAINGNEF